MSLLLKDVVVLPESSPAFPDRWVLMNVMTRTCLGVNSAVLRFIGSGGTEPTGDAESMRVWEIHWFSNGEELLEDPTRYRRSPAEWGEGRVVDAAALHSLLRKWILVADDAAPYRARFARKTSLLDAQHFGNFHDQVGSYLMLQKRTSPSAAWLRQKFTPDLMAIRGDNLYGAVQDAALTDYFARRLTGSLRIVDLGCGTGFFANRLARMGHRVLGIDPNAEYIEIARRQAVPGAEFLVRPIGQAGALEALQGEGADVVFMSDALLFYFVPVSTKEPPDLGVLLAEIRRLLKPGGRFISVEPHPVFYLAPWMGDLEWPFTVVTEYRHRRFSSVPSFGQLFTALAEHGFLLSWMEELYADPGRTTADPRAHAFAREFPLWCSLELTPR